MTHPNHYSVEVDGAPMASGPGDEAQADAMRAIYRSINPDAEVTVTMSRCDENPHGPCAAHPTERITTDGDAWVCVCGNEPHRDGFWPSDLTGIEQEPTIDGPWDGVHYTCAACGRVIDQVTLAVVARGTFVPLDVTP